MKFLLIQTAFIGDVILATPLIEQLRRTFPDATIDFALRKGNESLLLKHPHLRKVFIWRKKEEKYRGLWRLLRDIRRERYDWVINCQRFAASGVLTVLSGARHTVGFNKNPLSLFFSRRVPHRFGTATQPLHEVERNLSLIAHLMPETPNNKLETSSKIADLISGMPNANPETPNTKHQTLNYQTPKLYPSPADYAKASQLSAGTSKYVCIAPTSVWFTKQYPAHKWIELIRMFPPETTVFLLGAPGDLPACEVIRDTLPEHKVLNVAGKLSFLESAALMKGAAMNYVNDSAPMHLASAVNAPLTAVFCSTVPAFGFTPLSQNARVVETAIALECRPCGLHGYKSCPKGHFRCAETIHPAAFKTP